MPPQSPKDNSLLALLQATQNWLLNHWPQILAALAILCLCLFGIWFLVLILARLAKHWQKKRNAPLLSHLCTSSRRPIAWLGCLVSLRLALLPLPVSNPTAALWIHRIFISIITLAFAIGLNSLLNTACNWLIEHETKAQKAQQVLLTDLLRRAFMAVIWFLTLFFLLQNVFSLNVSALLAGAGVIGLALAFAAQNTVANLFGAVSLIGDAPFKIGDWVKIGDQEGTVEAIGLRSMRLRAFTGELFVIPNRVAADALITNHTNRTYFRQTLTIALTYSTSPQKMREAIRILEEILAARPLCSQLRKPVITFAEMQDWSLNINIVIWFNTGDYWQKGDEISAINLQILERFNAAGLEFAFPTNTTYIVQN